MEICSGAFPAGERDAEKYSRPKTEIAGLGTYRKQGPKVVKKKKLHSGSVLKNGSPSEKAVPGT